MKKSKIKTLKGNGTLNPNPDKVKDPLFDKDSFFDSNDLLQVKYEMLRKARDGVENITLLAKEFGFSRITYYRLKSLFESKGISGLLPQQKGPKEAHKLSSKVMDYLEEKISEDPSLKAKKLKEIIASDIGILVHHRSIEKALNKRKKNKK